MATDHPLWPGGRSGAYRLIPGMGIIFLVLPLIATLRRSHPVGHDVLVVVIVAAFAAVFAWTVSLLAREDGPPWERRAEILSVLFLLAVPLVLCLIDAGGWSYCFVYSLFPLLRVIPKRWRWALVAVIGGLAYGVGSAAGASQSDSFAALCVVLGTGASALGFSRIVEANVALQEAQEGRAQVAVAEERLRFARDLHDLLGHSLSVIALKSEVAGRLIASDQARAGAEVREIEAVARRALREVREAVSGYRQATLAVEVASARSALASSGVTWSEEVVDAEALEAAGADGAVEAVLAWTVREGVTNVLRHSRAGSCAVEVALRDGAAQATVTDDGTGPVDGAGPGLVGGGGSGLAGLAERASAVGGALTTGPGTDGGGFRLQVTVPLDGHAAPAGQRAQDTAGNATAPAPVALP